MKISGSFILRIKNISGRVVEKIKIQILFPINIFFKNRAVYEIMWKNSTEPSRPQMTMWRMRLACWVPKDTDVHSEYAIFIAFLLLQWWHERVSMLRYTYT